MTVEKGYSRTSGVCAAYQEENLAQRLCLLWEEPISAGPNSENEARERPSRQWSPKEGHEEDVYPSRDICNI